MADILIRGMEMPGNCRECGFAGFGGIRSELNVCMFSGESQSLISHERMSKCPLLPLPEGHGRLGDLDVLLESMRESYQKAQEWRDNSSGEIYDRADATVMAFLEFGNRTKNAPTIVPAEGGEDDGSKTD